MSGRSYVAIPAAVLNYHAKPHAVRRLPASIASRLAELRFAWRRRAARRRLARSIAHLDDRLLTDIGLGPERLGFAGRVARSAAANVGMWTATKRRSGTDWR